MGESEPKTIIRPDAKGEADDIYVQGVDFRMERMDSGHWWIGVSRGDKRLCFGLHSSRRIRATWWDEGLEPYDDSDEWDEAAIAAVVEEARARLAPPPDGV